MFFILILFVVVMKLSIGNRVKIIGIAEKS